MFHKRAKILLVNASIYDFSAYDFWIKPVGLLYLGSILLKLGYEVSLVDSLDRYHPLLRQNHDNSDMRDKLDGSGKFHREEIEKPPVLQDILRKYCRYGAPISVVHQMLGFQQTPDVILLSSAMTYWYPAVRDMAHLLRNYFPETPIILGGWYATLCPEHAKEIIKPDALIQGEGEEAAVQLVAKWTCGPGENFTYRDLDELPYPAYQLYPELKSVAILTSRGCPYTCSFCASRLLTKSYRRRSVTNFINELHYWHDQFNVSHFAFYDDALLFDASIYAKPLFRILAQEKIKPCFYTPNGVQPRYIDEEMAGLLFEAGVQSLRLSFESANPLRQKMMSDKVCNQELLLAVKYLTRAGFTSEQIGVYVLMGLPDQDIAEVLKSVQFVHDLGIKTNLASFSPIPGTEEWDRAIKLGLWKADNDLLLSNNSIFPLWRNKYNYQACLDLTLWVKELNQKVSRI